MIQPAGFTMPPTAPDTPELLPDRCRACGGFLGLSTWGWEEIEEWEDDGGSGHHFTRLVFHCSCPKCGRLIVV